MGTRSRVDEVVLRSRRLLDQFTLPIYNLETGEYHSSRFAQVTAGIVLRFRKQLKLLAGVTICLFLMTALPPLVNYARRRLSGSVTSHRQLKDCEHGYSSAEKGLCVTTTIRGRPA